MQNLILVMFFKVLLREVVKQNSNYLKGQKVMFDSCVTRWLENLNSYSMFLTTFPYIIETRFTKITKITWKNTLNGGVGILDQKQRAVALLGNNHFLFH